MISDQLIIVEFRSTSKTPYWRFEASIDAICAFVLQSRAQKIWLVEWISFPVVSRSNSPFKIDLCGRVTETTETQFHLPAIVSDKSNWRKKLAHGKKHVSFLAMEEKRITLTMHLENWLFFRSLYRFVIPRVRSWYIQRRYCLLLLFTKYDVARVFLQRSLEKRQFACCLSICSSTFTDYSFPFSSKALRNLLTQGKIDSSRINK